MTPLDSTPPNPTPGLPPATDNPRLSTSMLLTGLATAGGENGPALPPGLSAAPTFGGLLHALRRRWVLGILLAILATSGAIAGVLAAMPAQYVSTLRFRLASRPDQKILTDGGGEDSSEFLLFKANQQALVASPLVLTRALKEKLPDGREVRELGIVRARGAGAVDWLEKALKSDFLSGPEYMRVTLGTDDPEEGALLLNAISKSYLAVIAENTRSARDEQLKDYKERYQGLNEQHRRLMGQLTEKTKKDPEAHDRDTQMQQLAQASSDASAAKQRLREIQGRRDETQTEIFGLEAKLKLVPEAALPPERLEEALRADAVGAAYYKQLQDIALEADYYRRILQNPEPYVRKCLDKAADVRRRMVARRDQIRPDAEEMYREKLREEFKKELAIANSKLNSYATQEKIRREEVHMLEAAAQALIKNASQEPTDVKVLKDEIEINKKTLETIKGRIDMFDFEQPRSRVTLLQEAAPPLQKDYSRQVKLAGGGGLAAFAFVLFGVAFLEFRSRKISVAEEVSHGLGLSVVGALPAIPDRARRALTTTEDFRGQVWHTQLNEAVDAVRTLLLHTARTEALRVIMVTSADSGEGKTSLASQLAASLARAWRRTLLIDGDLRHPATHKLFDVPPEPGFSEVLRGEIQAADAVRATPHSRLWVLPAGTWDYHALQALAQEEVRTLFEELKQQYDFIIVDSPPVLPVADSLLLGQHVDGVLFSILRDVSRAPAVYAAQQKLMPLGIRILGAVMVGAEAEAGRGRYRYLTHKAE